MAQTLTQDDLNAIVAAVNSAVIDVNIVSVNDQPVSVDDLFVVRVNTPVNRALQLTSGGSYKVTGSKDSRIYFQSSLFPLMTGLLAASVKLYIKDLKTNTMVCNGLAANEINTTDKKLWFSYGTNTTPATTALVAGNPCKYQVVFEYDTNDKEIVARGICNVAPNVGA